jgi:hypothetical protein
MIPELPGAVPEIPVSDVVAATEYYRDKLSFGVDWLEADIALAGSRAISVGSSSPAQHSAKNAATPVPC